jgi:5-methylthioadenosine/S-adenosylhomocysteine deaminase
VVDVSELHAAPTVDVVSALVYSAQASDVRATIIDGQVVMRDRELLTLDEATVLSDANRESEALRRRVNI